VAKIRGRTVALSGFGATYVEDSLRMSSIDQLLRLAVEDNVAWCSAICSAQGSHEAISSGAWANLGMSPPFYPNIITRQPGAQKEVQELAREVGTLSQLKRWGIKDSFRDLMLSDQGFEQLLLGNWYGGTVTTDVPANWKTIASSTELRSWENAWGGGEERIFPNSLLSDGRITFWFKGEVDVIEAGFISFDSGSSLGLSNWFSRDNHSLARMGALQAVSSVSRHRPIVCWSTDALEFQETGLAELGPLQVWISKEA
jgi:hypothetical protein